ncbi:MAG: glycosidase [Clostridiales bacterium]|jgi:predicted GH43/DUF377 family glycosyl hydrolase|nr:glycosidase [Clostridiales bacterium]
MKLTKCPENPILTANPAAVWESLCVLNPAVVYDNARGEFAMLYRAAGNDVGHCIRLGLATSKDGIHFTRASDKPALSPDPNGADSGCIEDPRLVEMGGWYYMTYASRAYAPGQYWRSDWEPYNPTLEYGPAIVNQNLSATHLAISKDLREWKKLGRISDSRVDDRDVILFPEKAGDKFARLSRPMTWYGKGYPCRHASIWIAYSDDLMEWGKPEFLMQGREWWEDLKIGGGCPPIKTDRGWFHLYHGVAEKDGGYRVGAVLLDLENPSKILARTKDFLMEPEFDFEKNGYYNGCVFPTGNVVKDGALYVYYGAADKCVCLATADFGRLTAYLADECRVK